MLPWQLAVLATISEGDDPHFAHENEHKFDVALS